MHLLFFAHKAEAHAFISCGQVQKIHIEKHIFYKTDKYYVYVTNCPPTIPDINLTELKISAIINMGVAAAVNDHLELNKIYPIKSFKFQKQIITKNCDGKLLITLSEPYQRHNYEGLTSDLADQEGFHLCKWAIERHLPFLSYKIISDFGEINLEHVKKNAQQASRNLFEFYKQLSI